MKDLCIPVADVQAVFGPGGRVRVVRGAGQRRLRKQGQQARFLQSRGCAEIQGFYFFYKSMPEEDFEALYDNSETIPPEM